MEIRTAYCCANFQHGDKMARDCVFEVNLLLQN